MKSPVKSLMIVSRGPEETMRVAALLAGGFRPGDIVCLLGDLGAGKTTFVKGIAQGLKINSDDVSSPTFVLLNIYEGRLPLYHFDLYRIDGAEALGAIGYEEFLYGQGAAVIEWADKLGALCPSDYLEVKIAAGRDQRRVIRLSARGKKYAAVIDQLILTYKNRQ